MSSLDNLKIPDFELRAPKRISPSQFTTLRKCAYREVLRESLGKPLLPPHPAAYLGSIIHKILEYIAIARITERSQFLEVWNELVQKKEEELSADGLDEYLPLKRAVPYFAIRKFQTLKYLEVTAHRQDSSSESKRSTSEKWFQSNDGKIGGVIDLILKREKVSLIDFKTGNLFEDEAGEMIKTEYETQIKLYAWLYFEREETYPDELFLVDLKRCWYSIPFVPQECEMLAKEAKNKLAQISQKVTADQRGLLANPTPESCQYCSYKPACSYYWDCTFEEAYLVDLRGELKKIDQSRTGTFRLTIKNGLEINYVISFQLLDFTTLQSVKNQVIQVFNLGKTEFPGVYAATKSTRLYVETK